jgi:tetratricopeptide (TPR) repeat protein
MTTTLIVRDATLAINGAPEKRDEPRSHLRLRVAEVAHMDARTAEECVEVLSSVASGESADPDVLEALVIVGLAHPTLAGSLELDTLGTGRRVAAQLERNGEVDRTFAVLEILQQHFSGDPSLERELAQLMRRQGMVKDLVGRYFDRARKLVREGRTNEAAGWLREVLQLDPTRKDAARLLRDLRFKRRSRAKRVRIGLRPLFIVAVVSLGLSYLALREVRLHGEYVMLPGAVNGNANSIRRRLHDVEQFIEQHPLWHGGLRAIGERTELRLELALLEERERAQRDAAEQAERERLESADLSRARGAMYVQSGDLRGGLVALREALQYGGPGWVHAEQVARDVAALEASLSEKQP